MKLILVIDEFKKVGLDTAKSIIELEKEDLIKRTDLEEAVNEVIRILKAEFEVKVGIFLLFILKNVIMTETSKVRLNVA